MGLEDDLYGMSNDPDLGLDDALGGMSRFVLRRMADAPEQVPVGAVAEVMRAIAAVKKSGPSQDTSMDELMAFWGDDASPVP